MQLVQTARFRRMYDALTFSNAIYIRTYSPQARVARAIYRLSVLMVHPRRQIDVYRALQKPLAKPLADRQPQLYFKYLRQQYLASDLSCTQKSRILAFHYGYIADRLTDRAVAQLSSGGTVLWEETSSGNPHKICLSLPDKVDAEGELALLYLFNERIVQCLSFTFVPEAIWTGKDRAAALVSRIQAIDDDPVVLRTVARDYHDIAPRFALAAALQGVLLALGQSLLFAVSVNNHITLRNRPSDCAAASYDDFLTALGGQQRTDGYYELALPFPEKDLSALSSQHRKRARKRRGQRLAIVEQSSRSMVELMT